MKIEFEKLLLLLVVSINSSDESDQPPNASQPPNERRRRRSSEIPDHAERRDGGLGTPRSNQPPTRSKEFHDFFGIGSSSVISHAGTPRPRPRLDTESAGLPMQREQSDIHPPGSVHTNPTVELTIQGQQTQVNADDNPGSSSGTKSTRGGRRVGAGRPRGPGRKAPFHPGDVFKKPLERPHDIQVPYMGKQVLLWLDNQTRTQVEQAEFQDMTRPYGPNFYQNFNFLVRLDKLENTYPTVVYLWQNGTIMGVRAPKQTNADVMEPTENMWFIVYYRKYFRLLVSLGSDGPIPQTVDLAARNGRPLHPNDVIKRATFPYDIILCIYEDGRTNIEGAFIPGYVNNQWRGC